MKVTEQLRATAYHEAGHAVISYWQLLPFKYVTIIPDKEKDTLGHVVNWPMPKWFQPDIECSTRIRNKIEKNIHVFFAGHIAEKKFTGHKSNGAYQDEYNALLLGSYVNGDNKSTELYLNWLWNCTEGQVDHHWKEIEVLANELLNKQTLSSKEVKKLLINLITKH